MRCACVVAEVRQPAASEKVQPAGPLVPGSGWLHFAPLFPVFPNGEAPHLQSLCQRTSLLLVSARDHGRQPCDVKGLCTKSAFENCLMS